MQMEQTPRLYPRLRWRTLALALIGAGIVHICMTFAWPYVSSGDAVLRLVNLCLMFVVSKKKICSH